MPAEDCTQTQARLTDLEVKASYAEDLLEQLDAVVIRQQMQIDRLVGALNQLSAQIDAGQHNQPRQPLADLRDDMPPHF